MDIVNKNEIYLKVHAGKLADKSKSKELQQQTQKIAYFLNDRYFNGKSRNIKLTIFCTDETIMNENSMIRFKFN